MTVKYWADEAVHDQGICTELVRIWPSYNEEETRQFVEEFVMSKMFEDAADYIEAHGWIQYTQWDKTGSVCAIGGLMKVSGVHDMDTSSMARFASDTGIMWTYCLELMGLAEKGWRSIPSWNDTEGRTKEEVLEALMTAAKKLRDLGR